MSSVSRPTIQIIKQGARTAQGELDRQIAAISNVCGRGCDACCHQVVAVHSWEEELVLGHIATAMHAQTKKRVRSQLAQWWKDFRSLIRPVSRVAPLTLQEFQVAQLRMAQLRVPCPFLVDHECSIYQVRPAICRSHVVTSAPEQCQTDIGRIGDARGGAALLATFGPHAHFMPVEVYPHFMKPLAFAVTEAFGLPIPSTPLQVIALGDLIPAPRLA